MKYAILQKPKSICLQDKSLPPLGGNQLRVKVALAGVCAATELHYYRGEFQDPFPCDSFNSYFGHEGCGTVLEVGSGVTRFSVGDRITYLGPSFCEEAIVEASRAVILPDDISWEKGIGEPIAVAVNTLNHCKRYAVDSNPNVLLTGCGPVGLLLLQGLKAKGCNVTVVELREDRAKSARDFGADLVITEVRKEGMERINDSFSLTIESSGAPAALALCAKALQSNGTLIVHSFFPDPVNVDMVPWHCKQLTVVNSHIPTDEDLRACIVEGLALTRKGILNSEKLISHRWALEDVAKAFEHLDRGESSLKMVVCP